MGGNAMAPYGARRFEREEYLELAKEIKGKLTNCMKGRRFEEIPSYHKKESFGDMDVLTWPLYKQDYERILEEFKVTHYLRNSDVLSFLYKELQVDIIPMPVEDYDSAMTYYSYNDLGNLMGKLFAKFGLKYGHRGLTLPMRDGTNQYDEIQISKNPYHIFNFLGLKYQRFQEGFETLEDVFEFVMSSPKFSPEPFQYENLNHANRIRDRKRTTYHAFLEHIAGKTSDFVYNRDKDSYRPEIFAAFPGVKEKYDKSREALAFRLAVKERLNGQLVAEWTGFEEEELGFFMRYLKDALGDFPKWVMNFSPEKVKEMVKKEVSVYLKGRSNV